MNEPVHGNMLGKRFGPYILLKRLGQGGMAEVFLAAKLCGLGAYRLVALKCILGPYNNVEDYVRLFYHEAGVGLRLVHENLVGTFDCGMIDGRHTMAMDPMYGATVAQLLTMGKIPREVSVWIGACALSGLDHLHHLKNECGEPLHIVHRDISPDNIFVGYDGRVRVFDFGVAHYGCEVDDIQQGMMVGKYAYMSPEQCRGESVDARSDIFSLACVLYEMLMGKSPFLRESDIQTIDAVIRCQIQPPNQVDWTIPAYLSQCLVHGLESDISRRYGTAGKFASELRDGLKMRGILDPQALCRNYMQTTFAAQMAEEQSYLHTALKAISPYAPSLEQLIQKSRIPTDDLIGTDGRMSEIAVSKILVMAKK